MFRRFLIAEFALAGVASPQQFPSSSVRVLDGQVTAIYGPARSASVITGAPYSADQLQEYTPPGGTSPTSSGIIGHFARDSQGRTRSSRAFKTAPYWLTEIFDPVAGVAILLEDQAKVAHRMAVQTPPVPDHQGTANSSVQTETLGTRLIDGVIAEGTRVSGALVLETWKAPELKVDLLTRSSNGYSHRLINLSRNEPDPALFRPPADYRVVDETKPFAMTIRAE